jgi:two-component system OmpR family sensor kinase
VSVRVRITAAVALAVMLALTLAGVIVYVIEYQRIEDQMVAQIDQEFAELAKLQQDADAGGTPYPSVGAMLQTFLERNVPEENEVLVSWYDGRPQLSSPTGTREFASSPFFTDTVTPLLADNGTTHVQVPGYGDAVFSVQDVTNGREDGALVVVTYLEEGRAGLRDTIRTYAITSLMSLLLVSAFAAWMSGRLLAPLRTLRDTADEITDTDLSRRLPVTGNDDITALTRTVNGMLDRLESAFVGQRQFLDDAGHELKTPLTVLRGHLELLDVGSPQDVEETKALLLDEVDRMARLVGDLILLAKSDRPDFVTTGPVDLTTLTLEVLAKARGLGERTWLLDGTDHARVPLDEQRLTQALLQLCDNAVKHTVVGDVIALGSSYDGQVAELWVRDTGPGISPGERDVIFARFGRGAVHEDDEGFGLGLSIVHAIVTAHGGTVNIEDGLPTGACFVLTLPVGDETGEPTWPAS